MPPIKATVQQLRFVADAVSRAPLVANPRRLSLLIQNTGNNPGLLSFERDVQFDGGDYVIMPGESFPPSGQTSVITDKVSLASTLGTTFVIIEGFAQ